MLVGVDEYIVSSCLLTSVLLGCSSHQLVPTWGWAELNERMLERHPAKKQLTLALLPECALSGPRHLAGEKNGRLLAELENVLTNPLPEWL